MLAYLKTLSAGLALVAISALATGCNQSMKISVERLKVPAHVVTPEHEVHELGVYLSGTIGHQVALSGVALHETQDRIDAYRAEKQGSSFERLNLTDPLRATIQQPAVPYPDLTDLIDRQAEVAELIESAAAGSAQYQFVSAQRQAALLSTLSATVAQARMYLSDVDQALATVKRINTRNMDALDRGIRDARAGLNADEVARAQFSTLQQLRKILDEVPRASAALRQAQQVAASTRPRFGGYASESVHTISPGDPAYDYVLNADPHRRPISLVSSSAWGDSTIMFVQESPTQMRVFTVDVDGTQLAQNIMLITDKALQAAVNHLSPLPLGGGAPTPASE